MQISRPLSFLPMPRLWRAEPVLGKTAAATPVRPQVVPPDWPLAAHRAVRDFDGHPALHARWAARPTRSANAIGHPRRRRSCPSAPAPRAAPRSPVLARRPPSLVATAAPPTRTPSHPRAVPARAFHRPRTMPASVQTRQCRRVSSALVGLRRSSGRLCARTHTRLLGDASVAHAMPSSALAAAAAAAYLRPGRPRPPGHV